MKRKSVPAIMVTGKIIVDDVDWLGFREPEFSGSAHAIWRYKETGKECSEGGPFMHNFFRASTTYEIEVIEAYKKKLEELKEAEKKLYALRRTV